MSHQLRKAASELKAAYIAQLQLSRTIEGTTLTYYAPAAPWLLVVFLLGERLGGRWAGLMAAGAVAVYPPFIHSTGELMSEPPAIFTLPAAVLAFLWASEQERSRAWP